MKEPDKTPTMAEIAAEAGVSKMTVSLALRASHRVSKERREHILKIAERMNYRPNPMVQTLMANLRATRPASQDSTLAWVTSFQSESGWRKHRVSYEYFQGALQRGHQLGYRVEPVWAAADGMTGRRLTEILRARGIYGVIVPPVEDMRDTPDLDWQYFSSATMGFSFTTPKLHRAAANLRDAMALALEKCVAAGYRRIGFVTPAATDQRVNHAWMAAYLTWRYFIDPQEALDILYVGVDERIEDALGDWLRLNRPEVILSPNTELLEWLPERFGLNVPEDIGYVCLAKPAESEQRERITGINQDDANVGAAAIDLVVAQLQRNEYGLPSSPKIVLIEGIWEEGETLLTRAEDLSGNAAAYAG